MGVALVALRETWYVATAHRGRDLSASLIAMVTHEGSCPMQAQIAPRKVMNQSPIGRVAVVRPNGKSSFCNWTYFGVIREVLSVEPKGMRCVA